jgi:hypothetical protein
MDLNPRTQLSHSLNESVRMALLTGKQHASQFLGRDLVSSFQWDEFHYKALYIDILREIPRGYRAPKSSKMRELGRQKCKIASLSLLV